MTTDTPRFRSGDVVYHKAGAERGVVRYAMYGPAGFLYQVSWEGRVIEENLESELTKRKPEIEKTFQDTEDEEEE